MSTFNKSRSNLLIWISYLVFYLKRGESEISQTSYIREIYAAKGNDPQHYVCLKSICLKKNPIIRVSYDSKPKWMLPNTFGITILGSSEKVFVWKNQLAKR